MSSSLGQWGDFGKFVLPSQVVLRGLVEAHEQGYQCFSPDTAPDRRRRDKMELRDKLTNGPPPDYDDPFVAAAYLDTYHLSHCMMAYWVLMHFLGHVGNMPNPLYVCDIGAGTGAARVGLALALLKRKKSPPTIHFDAVEPSVAMRDAGNSFWEALLETGVVCDVAHYFEPQNYRECAVVPERLPYIRYHPLRVVTAFHLSLPYDSRREEGKERCIGDKAQQSIRSAVRRVSPHVGLFTSHPNKAGSLDWAVGNFACWGDSSSCTLNKVPDKLPIHFKPSPTRLLWRDTRVRPSASAGESRPGSRMP